jgi:para-nitrobenzyl esterase
LEEKVVELNIVDHASDSTIGRVLKKTLSSLSLLFAAGTMWVSLHGAAAAPGPLVGTQEGIVKGFITNGVAEFLGVPYAEPPVGNLRWKPSKKHALWAGVLTTQAYANTCAQIETLGVFAGPANNNEDCLYLNVFTPNLDPSARLPVMFWIHGGGNVDGESNDYDASKLASDGKTVVVTINYRLNLIEGIAGDVLGAVGIEVLQGELIGVLLPRRDAPEFASVHQGEVSI